MADDVVPELQGKTILEAKLILNPCVLEGDPAGNTFRAAAIVESWNPSSVSWNVWQTMHSYAGGAVDFSPVQAGIPQERDITVIVQGWPVGPSPTTACSSRSRIRFLRDSPPSRP